MLLDEDTEEFSGLKWAGLLYVAEQSLSQREVTLYMYRFLALAELAQP